jgi:hypothetical protein
VAGRQDELGEALGTAERLRRRHRQAIVAVARSIGRRAAGARTEVTRASVPTETPLREAADRRRALAQRVVHLPTELRAHAQVDRDGRDHDHQRHGDRRRGGDAGAQRHGSRNT